MLSLFRPRPNPSQAAARPRRVSLSLEPLEERFCPAAPPQITLTAQPVNSGRMVELSGSVVDSDPASVHITFSGAVSASTTANASGKYDCVAQASGLGTVSATGYDSAGLYSAPAQATLNCTPPSLTLSVAYGAQRTITLSGQVSDAQAGACAVYFSGVATGSTTTNPDGTYSFTVSASGLGTVQATAQDPWAQTSAPARVSVTSTPPWISNFQAIHGAQNVWTFQGQVTCASAQGLVVRFAGIPSLAGQTATVDANGWFHLTIQLQPGEQGTVSAQTTDWWGQSSNESMTSVQPAI